MKCDVSEKFRAEIQRATAEWESIQKSFQDDKANEFEAKIFQPLIVEAYEAVEWFGKLESEMDSAERCLATVIT
jgi:hypothetical protein